MDDRKTDSSPGAPFHQKNWFQGTLLILAAISAIFTMIGPVPKEWLESIPNGLSLVFQRISALLAAYGLYVALVLVSLLAFWKRQLFLKTLRVASRASLHIYTRVLAFLLRPAVHKVLVERREDVRLLIISATYGAAGIGAQGGFKDVAEILRRKIVNGQLELIVSNDSMGGDPAYGVRKKLIVDYLHAGKRLSKTVVEGQSLKLP